jgi:hypothetical protein
VSFSEDQGFNAEIFSCVDRTLSSILGDASKQALYHLVSQTFKLPQPEFRKRPLEFAEDLQKILGESGYSLIESSIIREIHSFFKLENEPLNLEDAINQARTNFILDSKRK